MCIYTGVLDPGREPALEVEVADEQHWAFQDCLGDGILERRDRMSACFVRFTDTSGQASSSNISY